MLAHSGTHLKQNKIVSGLRIKFWAPSNQYNKLLMCRIQSQIRIQFLQISVHSRDSTNYNTICHLYNFYTLWCVLYNHNLPKLLPPARFTEHQAKHDLQHTCFNASHDNTQRRRMRIAMAGGNDLAARKIARGGSLRGPSIGKEFPRVAWVEW